MTKRLLEKLANAVEQEKSVEELGLAIVQLSQYESATATLIRAYRDALLDDEQQWRELEAHPDYPYATRADAVKDYLRHHSN